MNQAAANSESNIRAHSLIVCFDCMETISLFVSCSKKLQPSTYSLVLIFCLCSLRGHGQTEKLRLFWSEPVPDSGNFSAPALVIRNVSNESVAAQLDFSVYYQESDSLLLQKNCFLQLNRGRTEITPFGKEATEVDTTNSLFKFMLEKRIIPGGMYRVKLVLITAEDTIRQDKLWEKGNTSAYAALKSRADAILWPDNHKPLLAVEGWSFNFLPLPFITSAKASIEPENDTNRSHITWNQEYGCMQLLYKSKKELIIGGFRIADTVIYAVSDSSLNRELQFPGYRHTVDSFLNFRNYLEVDKLNPVKDIPVIMSNPLKKTGGNRMSGTAELEYYVGSDPYVNDNSPTQYLRLRNETSFNLFGIPLQLSGFLSTETSPQRPMNAVSIRYDRDNFIASLQQDELDLKNSILRKQNLDLAEKGRKEALLSKLEQQKNRQKKKILALDSLWDKPDSIPDGKVLLKSKIQAGTEPLNEQVGQTRAELHRLQQSTAIDSGIVQNLSLSDKAGSEITATDLKASLSRMNKLNSKAALLAGVADFEIGLVSRQHTRYTWNGALLNGGTAGYEFGRTKVLVGIGKVLMMPLSGYQRDQVYADFQTAYFSYGSSPKNLSYFSLLHGGYTPAGRAGRLLNRNNNVMALGQKRVFKEQTTVEAELAHAFNYIKYEESELSGTVYNSIMDPDNYAGNLSIEHRFLRYPVKLEGSFEQVNRNFNSVGVLFQKRNFREINVGFSGSFFRSMADLSLAGVYLENQLQTNNKAMGLVAKLKLQSPKLPVLDIHYAPYKYVTPLVISDSVEFAQNSRDQFRIRLRYNLKTGKYRHQVTAALSNYTYHLATEKRINKLASTSYTLSTSRYSVMLQGQTNLAAYNFMDSSFNLNTADLSLQLTARLGKKAQAGIGAGRQEFGVTTQSVAQCTFQFPLSNRIMLSASYYRRVSNDPGTGAYNNSFSIRLTSTY